MRWRRLSWWRTVLRSPEEHVQMIEALFGVTNQEKRSRTTLPPSPWLDQLMVDLTVCLITQGYYFDVREDFMKQGREYMFGPWWTVMLGRVSKKKIKAFRVERTGRMVGEVPIFYCGHEDDEGRCLYFGTAQAVATHRRVAHGFVNGYRGVVFQNKCNVCGTVFKTLEGTKQHTEKAFARGGCPVHRTSYKGVVEEQAVHEYKCTLCLQEVRGRAEIRRHMLDHMVEIVQREEGRWPGLWDAARKAGIAVLEVRGILDGYGFTRQ